ncbi:cyanoexosortase C [Mastigocladopsis repens]|uniref:cyanoexosortase C n=1 Tax=Mastigocladopsis repens TaxID=221287 RepID=UPI0002F8F313|nr:cyanoexosortase C [Mastigocladopsis repens]
MGRLLLCKSPRTAHDWIVLCGLVVGLWYLPSWLGNLLNLVVHGVAFPLLVFVAAYLAIQELWHQRNQLAKLIAPVQQRRLGHILILTSVGLFPFCRFAFWPQALLWFLVLVGITLSSWGVSFFKKYPCPTFLILLSVHPTPNYLVDYLWRTVNYHTLEQLVAWSSSLALQAIGQSATSTHNLIYLGTGAIQVEWGCTGTDMAITMATTSLLLGLILKQSWLQTVGLVIVGITLAFVLNVPRIMLLAFANSFWGKEAFEFWHGGWGEQIFSTILFTIYYYLMKAIFSERSVKSRL